VLDTSEHGDLFVENFKRWLLGLNSIQDLFRHPFECLIFLFFSILVDLDMLLLSWVNTGVEESFEIFLEGLLPKE
jgi:hypothetical protein